MSDNSFNSKEPHNVSSTKKVFDFYFQAIGKRDFRQFYYDFFILSIYFAQPPNYLQ